VKAPLIAIFRRGLIWRSLQSAKRPDGRRGSRCAATPQPLCCNQKKSSLGSDPLRFHRFAAPWVEGNGGPEAPQSGHCTRYVPLNTTCGISPQNGQVFSLGMTSSLSTAHSSHWPGATDRMARALSRCRPLRARGANLRNARLQYGRELEAYATPSQEGIKSTAPAGLRASVSIAAAASDDTVRLPGGHSRQRSQGVVSQLLTA
jgi:hypothetical protein